MKISPARMTYRFQAEDAAEPEAAPASTGNALPVLETAARVPKGSREMARGQATANGNPVAIGRWRIWLMMISHSISHISLIIIFTVLTSYLTRLTNCCRNLEPSIACQI